jgi:hypothetical protein
MKSNRWTVAAAHKVLFDAAGPFDAQGARDDGGIGLSKFGDHE